MSLAVANCNPGTAGDLIWLLLFASLWGICSPRFPFGIYVKQDILAIKRLSCLGSRSRE
jgi:hypothetical protein